MSGRAIVGVCFDSKQKRILDLTIPSWRRYGQKNGLPVIIVEEDLAGGDHYWNKHLLYRSKQFRGIDRLLFLDNDVFVSSTARPLLNEWNSSLIGATFESTQANWSAEFVAQYYHDYCVAPDTSFIPRQIVNTGVLVIPREQSAFLEETYRQWKARAHERTEMPALRDDRHARGADQPFVSYALQRENRLSDFGSSFNTIWSHWYIRHINRRYRPFVFRSKAAAISFNHVPSRLWQVAFRRERAIFAVQQAESALRTG